LKPAIIVDLDGTLADVDHRVHHVQQQPKNWQSFHSGLSDDKLNHWCAQLIHAMKEQNCQIILMTGRGEEYRDQTIAWLELHQIHYDLLLMRPLGGREKDSDVKNRLYREKVEEDYQVLFVVEDRQSVVKMWRDNGLVCLQCDWGDF
jgi:uncharacterized HAD superfamily protein